MRNSIKRLMCKPSMRKCIGPMIASAFGLAVLLGTALPASAASSSGAQVFNGTQCVTFIPGFTVCQTGH